MDQVLKEYGLRTLFAKGSVGSIYTTEQSGQVVKVVAKDHPQAPYDHQLALYSLNNPSPALCPVYRIIELDNYFLTYKKKVSPFTPNGKHQLSTADTLAKFGSIFPFQSNAFQEEIDALPEEQKNNILLELQKKLRIIEKEKLFQPLAVFLTELLEKNQIIQDLRTQNLGINFIEEIPTLCILDGMLLIF